MTLKRRLFVTLFLAIFAFLPFAQTFQAANDDVTGHWHEDALREMIDKGIMKGYGSGVYKPDAQVTRGQFSAIIVRALNLEPANEGTFFTDVSEKSGVLNEVLAAANAGLITGYPDGSFKPGAYISREHMAVIVKRAIDYLQMEDKSTALTFEDSKSILKDYHPAISTAVSYGIFKGSVINGKTYFRPSDFSTRGDAAAVISRLLTAAAEHLGEEESPSLTFNTANIDSSGNPAILKKYDTFKAAETALNNGQGQVIVYNDTIIRMKSGVVITAPTPKSSLTYVYSNPDLRNHITYVSADTELEYVNSTEEYVQVRIAGQNGYIKQENAALKTWGMLKGRSYYASVNGELTHYIYSNQSNKFVSYNSGKAPAFMKAGEKYYSWNGVDFTTSSGAKAGSGYNYFQFLTARSETSYTAAEIDAYIIQTLKDLEKKYPNNTTYKNASTRSKLIGMGKHLKEVEKEKNVNALMILALAQHESSYGLSTRALTYNNLFGLRVYDDNPANDHFATVAENVDELIALFWNKNYIPPNASYANGSVFGSKAVGMNVRYASDPYWGAKAAGHWSRIDKAMGSKDFNKYILGMTTSTGQNARKTPEISNNIAYTYAQTGMPVILLSELPGTGRTWYKTSSDHLSYKEVYFAGEYIRKLPILK